MEEKTNKLQFYTVDVKYADFLRKYDEKVPYIEYPKHNKFFVGVVIQIGDLKYFAPVSSFNKKAKNTFNIADGDKIISSVRFNFMFPVIDGTYHLIDIDTEFSGKYWDLVQYEYQFCNNNRGEIKRLAKTTYYKRCRTKRPEEKKFLNKVVIDFKLLEKKCRNYKADK